MNGSIRRRGKNSWELTIDLGRDTRGKRLRKFVNVKCRKADAERKLRELLAAHDKGLPLDIGKLTVSEYMYRWHKDSVEANTRPRTAERYMGDIRNHLVPHLGRLLLTKVTPADVQRVEAHPLSAGLSPLSVRNVHRVLSEAYKHAVRMGLAWQNPCASIRPPRQTRKEIQIPDVAIVCRVLELAKETPYGTAFHFIAYTGVRRGEACGLKWEDVDLDRGVVSIRRAVSPARGRGLTIMPPKSEKGRRSITLDAETVEVLRSHQGAQLLQKAELGEAYSDQGYVFTGPLGNLLDPSVFTHNWEKLVKKAGFEGIRLHDLRHFHATLLLQQNVHPKVVQERLGHSQIQLTLDTYSHVVPGLQEKAAKAFADAMRQAASSP